MKVASTFCVVVSSRSRRFARGVSMLAAEACAPTIVLSENVVTASMLDARMPRMRSTASAPIRVASSAGI
ncbi:MAG TPA: hypothetical protein PL143_17585 [Rhodocyclaceae bacterium]|nr:hypothetical protein [Rhodocyclaceae bacterium]